MFALDNNQVLIKNEPIMEQKSNIERCKNFRQLKDSIFLKSLYLLIFTMLFSLLNLSALYAQQENSVNGTVTDSSGEPLPGVTVVIKGTTQGTVTNADGEYTLTNIPDDATLQFSFVGKLTQEVEVGSKNLINVVLKSDILQMDEVIVVGYGSQERASVTGSVATVSSERLTARPSANITELLAGTAPGLVVQQQSGLPGADNATISIRGFGAPLVLVDGIEMSMSRVDPEDIESITVLKDAAAAIYGIRAGNGVILITTKKGNISKPKITYKADFSIQAPTITPELLGSPEYATLINEAAYNENNAVGFYSEWSEGDIQKFRDGNDPDFANTDWLGVIFKDWAPMQSHNINMSGGTEKTRYFVSAGLLDQTAMYVTDDHKFKRYNVRANLSTAVNEYVDFQTELYYSRHDRREPTSGGLEELWTNIKSAWPTYPASYPDPTKAPTAGWSQRSPLGNIDAEKTGLTYSFYNEFVGSMQLSLKVPGVKGLQTAIKLNYRNTSNYGKTQDRPMDIYDYSYADDVYTRLGTVGLNRLTSNENKYFLLYPMARVTYDNTFGLHKVGGLFVFEAIDTKAENFWTQSMDLLSYNLPYHFAGSPANITNGGSKSETGLVSYIGRLNYAYDEKYLVEATIRADQSYMFYKDNRTGFFPSISAAWRVTEEDFMANVNWINSLKLRLSYTNLGTNTGYEPYRYLSAYEIVTGSGQVNTNYYLFGDQIYQQIRTTGLADISASWEKTKTYNIGIDATFLNNKLALELDGFYRYRYDIYGSRISSYPTTFGNILPQININSATNKGVDLRITHNNQFGDLKYIVAGSFSIAREKWDHFDEIEYTDPDEIRYLTRTGNYTNRWIGYKTDGIFMSQDEIDNHLIDQDQAGNATLIPGDIIYVDVNGDGMITEKDQDEIGYGTFPDMYFGLNTNISFKGFNLDALFQGASMVNTIVNGNLRLPGNQGNYYDFHYKYRWQPDSDNPGENINPDAKLPAIISATNANNNKVSDFWLKDGTYLRLKSLSLSYNLPQKWVKTTGFSGAMFTLSGTNLFTVSALGIYKNSIDPESNSGNRLKMYPPVKILSMGIKVTL
jgi:TonB-linked SusC/RagA family outer membrane protein